jgi:Fe-S-cluster containining protein
MSSPPPALNADPQEKVDWLQSEYGARFRTLLDEATELVDGPESLDRRALRLVEIARELANRVAPLTPCGSGCAHCCKQPVAISSWEAARIAKFTGRKLVDPVGVMPGQDNNEELRRRYGGVPCPMLRNNRCTVYAVRPLACIGHHSLASDPAVCDTARNPDATVQGVDDEEFIFIKVGMFFTAGCKSADIREFFPR